jgi:hypothetical protein
MTYSSLPEPKVHVEIEAFTVDLARSGLYSGPQIVLKVRARFPDVPLADVRASVRSASNRLLAQHDEIVSHRHIYK